MGMIERHKDSKTEIKRERASGERKRERERWKLRD